MRQLFSAGPSPARGPVAVTVRAAAAGLAAAGVAMLATCVAAGVAGRASIAAQALTAATVAGVAVTCAALVALVLGPAQRPVPVALAAVVTGSVTLMALGVTNPAVTAPGTELGCAFGVPRCIATARRTMPVLVRSGAVQARPVVRVLVFSGEGVVRRAVLHLEHGVSRLGQPLLAQDYGVAPAVDGGALVLPGDAAGWLRAHHAAAMTPQLLGRLVRTAMRRRGWTDTPDTQWWIATRLSPRQLQLPPGSCADHLHVPGIRGVVVRLSLAGCAAPATTEQATQCRAVTTIDSAAPGPVTTWAGVELLVGHEFAEAATDPTDGWRVLVRPRCGSALWLEIADVCQANGSFVRAPPSDTPIGWQPALLAPGRDGRPAYCADPARPQVALGGATRGRPARKSG